MVVDPGGVFGDDVIALYETGPYGERFLAIRVVPPQFKGDRVVAILNWFDQVRAKVPTK